MTITLTEIVATILCSACTGTVIGTFAGVAMGLHAGMKKRLEQRGIHLVDEDE